MPTVWDLFKLDGRVAIITGGAGRLGFQMATALAEAGAHCVLASRNAENCREKAAAISAGHTEAVGLQCDVTDRASVQSMVDAAEEQFGKIDILVNNAAGLKLTPLETMTPEEWEFSLRTCLTSMFYCAQAAGDAMLRQQRGVIVNIASIYGMVAADQRIYGDSGLNSPGVYAAAKGGVINFTRYLASYWAEDGIRCNCITPGGFFANQPEEFVENYCAKTMLGRMGNETDLKGAIVYLASDASAYVTGANLVVDGGWTAW